MTYELKVCLIALSECDDVYAIGEDHDHFFTKNTPLVYQKHICVDKNVIPCNNSFNNKQFEG